jgi:hypothetical protein
MIKSEAKRHLCFLRANGCIFSIQLIGIRKNPMYVTCTFNLENQGRKFI